MKEISRRILFSHRMTFATKASLVVESLDYTERMWVNPRPFPLSKVIYRLVGKKGRKVDVATGKYVIPEKKKVVEKVAEKPELTQVSVKEPEPQAK